MNDIAPAMTNFLPLKVVKTRVGFSRAWIYRKVKRREFPAPVLEDGSLRWVSTEIDAWIAARIAARDAAIEAEKAAATRLARRRAPSPTSASAPAAS